MKAIAIILALLYIVIGVALAFVLVRAFDPKCPEEAEAAATLSVFASIFWPFVLIVLFIAGTINIITEHRNEDQL